MSTLNEIAYRILNKIRPYLSDDENLDIREIKSEVHKQRALWIRNELNKNRTFDDTIVQDLKCVDVIPVDIAECCDVEIDCDIIRTKNKIPDPIELHNFPGIVRVGSIDKTAIPFTLIPYGRVPYVGNGRFNRNHTYTFLLNGYMYFISKNAKHKYLEKVNILGVFENPEALTAFIDCSEEACYSDDSPYPISAWMLPYIEAEITKAYLPTIQIPTDQSNDARGNIQTPAQQ